MSNVSLNKAKEAQEDEFYTQYEDIAAELPRYREQLKGKHIICPCDWDESLDEVVVYASEEECQKENLMQKDCTVKVIDTDKTDKHIEKDINLVKCNFVKFLIAHAEAYGIASISVSGYDPISNRGVRFQDLDYSKYDLVITNPPFSQMREFIEVMFERKKKFLVVASMNHVTLIDIFKRIQAGQMWLGYHAGDMAFKVPDYYESRDTRYWVDDEGQKWRSMGNACWLTNLEVSIRHDRLILTEEYDPERYPTYNNLDGIDVDALENIPYDYAGLMGVPLTILAKHNQEQFELVGFGKGNAAKAIGVTKNHRGRTDIEFTKPDGTYKCPYGRIIVRNRNPRPTDE